MKITENIYALDSTKGSYAYIIRGEECILIDTGRPGQGKGIARELESLGIEPGEIKHIMITHHDMDHIGNLSLLKKMTGASVWASSEDIPYICGDKKRHGIKRMFSYIMKYNMPGITPYPEGGVCGVEVIPSPGHTPGHVCLLYRDVLFAGDLIRGGERGYKLLPSFITWSRAELVRSIKRVAAYRFTWICPAHGMPLKRSESWESFCKDI